MWSTQELYHHLYVPPNSENFNNGYFILSRSLFESDIWCLKPPEYAKIWIYIIGAAAHKEQQRGGYKYQRGQIFVSSTKLAEQIKYKAGFCSAGKSNSTVKRVLKFLRDTGRITYTSAPRGYLITVLHYDEYQTSANYERTAERTPREPRMNQKRLPINKKDNNAKNDKYVALREKIVRHLATCNIENAEAYMSSIERKFPLVAVEKAGKDWCNGGGITSPGMFYSRVEHYAKKGQTQQSRPPEFLDELLSESNDALY